MNKRAKTKENKKILPKIKIIVLKKIKCLHLILKKLIFDLMYLDIYDEDVMYCMTC